MANNILKYKGYTHFDVRKKPAKYMNKVKNPCWVNKHGFYPFIHFQMIFNKYIELADGTKEKKLKERDIYYSSHVDRYIYQYYASKLNQGYNEYVKSDGTNKAVIGYRKGMKGKSNIHFAKEVFEFIGQQDNAVIMVGDFTNFFDNLDHKYLKKMINNVQGSIELSEDEYKVFRSITKFSFIELEDIEIEKGMKRIEMKKEEKYFSTDQFQEVKKSSLKTNNKTFGIPQGSAISAIYSNVYMIEFDRIINDIATGKRGLYRRYCDDFIIVIPVENIKEYELVINGIRAEINNLVDSIPRLELHTDKTQFLAYNSISESKFEDKPGCERILDYLGFSYDGKEVRLREKSLFKYYSRAYKKVRTLNKHIKRDNYNAIRKTLYRRYTHLGDKRYSTEHGNFITYARKAHEIMDSSKYLESAIRNQYKRHWAKIVKRIN